MNEQNSANNKSIFLIIAVVLVLTIAIFVVLNLKNSEEENNQKPTNQNTEELNNAIQTDGSSEVINPVVEKAIQVATGTSLISEEGEVVNNQGEKVELSAAPMTENAPRPSVAISKEDIPQDSVIITLSADSFSPERFTVLAGKSVSLAFTNNDKVAHTIMSRDKNLRALMLTVAPGENKVFVFNAPEQTGTYEIRSTHPRYIKNVIKMIVN